MVYSDRDIEPTEYNNLKDKSNFIQASFIRNNMFLPMSRGKFEEYKKPRLIYNNHKLSKSISVSHPLHQRHADVLFLIHAYAKASTPMRDGSYTLAISLYEIAKIMGYSDPKSGVMKVKKFIDDIF